MVRTTRTLTLQRYNTAEMYFELDSEPSSLRAHFFLMQGCLGVQLHVLEVFLPELITVVTANKEEVCPSAELVTPALALLASTTE